MRSFVKINSSRNGEITRCHLLMKVNHVIVANFYVANMYFNAFRENKMLAKISEFTVTFAIDWSLLLINIKYKIE